VVEIGSLGVGQEIAADAASLGHVVACYVGVP
jgi:hypothetical protein